MVEGRVKEIRGVRVMEFGKCGSQTRNRDLKLSKKGTMTRSRYCDTVGLIGLELEIAVVPA